MTLRSATLLLGLLLVGCNGDKSDDSGTSTDLVGSWSRDAPLDMGGTDVSAVWTGNADGSCEVALSSSTGNQQFSGSYTASGGNFTMVDEECDAGEGTYTYVVDGDQLSFTLIDDPCETRRVALDSSWTRM